MTVEGLGVPTRRIPRSSIEQIIELRLRELFEVIRRDLEKQRALERVGGGVKLCGGGALIPGIDRLAYEVFRLPSSVAKPPLLSGKEEILNAPGYLTPIGLIRWGRLMLEIQEERVHDDSIGRSLMRDVRSVFDMIGGALKW